MGGSTNFKGKSWCKPPKRGSFLSPGDFFVPISFEMTSHPAWRTLSATSVSVLLDMLVQFHQVSEKDTIALPKHGFTYNFSKCQVCCSPRTFTKAIKEITDRGWFAEAPRSRRASARFVPGNWRNYKCPDELELRSLPQYPSRLRGSKSPKTKNCKGHFWRRGELFVPISRGLLQCDAWRDITPLQRVVLIDMIQYFYHSSKFDHSDLSGVGLQYSFKNCMVNCTENAFDTARKAIVARCWFVTPAELQKAGMIHFVPGQWRTFRAPLDCKFRKTMKSKRAYLTKQATRLQKLHNFEIAPPKKVRCLSPKKCSALPTSRGASPQ